MWPAILVAIYCLSVAIASLAGGVLPSRMRLTHTRMQTIMSFVGGLVLGVGLLHLLPHSAVETDSLDTTVVASLLGLLTMFLLIRIFQVHQHGPIDQSQAAEDPHLHVDHEHHHHEHQPELCSHAAEYPIDGHLCATHRHAYSWIGLGVGLALHTMIDGMALAASVTADTQPGASTWHLLGFGTFLAVLLHKPLDAMSITSVMAAGGWSARAQGIVNLGFALMCAAGAVAFYLGLTQFGDQQQMVVGVALGFAAGVFLCISLADILPEVQFHAHDRTKLTMALLLGVLLAYAIGFIEPAHQHDAGPHAHHEISAPHEDGAHADGAHDEHGHFPE